jgi:hypothetical protein
MITGSGVTTTVTVSGASASSYGAEVDLTIDAAGDLLQIDPAGDVLEAQAGVLSFAGYGAAGSFTANGFSAAVVVGSELLTEPGGLFLGEDGADIQTES